MAHVGLVKTSLMSLINTSLHIICGLFHHVSGDWVTFNWSLNTISMFAPKVQTTWWWDLKKQTKTLIFSLQLEFLSAIAPEMIHLNVFVKLKQPKNTRQNEFAGVCWAHSIPYTGLLSNQVFEGQTKNLFLAVKPFFSVKLRWLNKTRTLTDL